MIDWYLNHAMIEGKFYDQYVSNHKHFYHPIPKGYKDLYFELPDLDDPDGNSALEEVHQKIIKQIDCTLNNCQPYPGDDTVIAAVDPTYNEGESRFVVEKIQSSHWHLGLCVYDRIRGFDAYLSWDIAAWDEFSIGKWYAERCAVENGDEYPCQSAHE